MAGEDVNAGAGPAEFRLSDLGPLLRRNGRIAVLFLANFIVAKGFAYFGPLFIASVVDTSVYGAVETALAASGFAATFLCIGVSAATPQQMLILKDRPVKDLLAASVAWSVALGLVAALGNAGAGGNPIWTLAAVFIAGAAIQQALTAYLRTASHRNLAVWTDNAATHAVVIVVAILLLMRDRSLPALIVASAFVAAAALALSLLVAWRTNAPAFRERLREAVWIGFPLVLSSMFSAWLTASGRVLMAGYLSAADAAHYALAFRVAGLMVVVHQIVGTGLFARLFGLSSAQFDRLASWYILAMACAGVIVALVISLALPPGLHFGHISSAVIMAARTLFPAVMAQMLFILVYAGLELRITRSTIAHRLLLPYVVTAILVVGAVQGLSLLHMLSARGLACMLILQTILGIAIQFTVLWRHGEKLPQLIRTCVGLCAGAAVLIGVLW
jgi:hypothetical protein